MRSSHPVKLGIIGCGLAAEHKHLPALRQLTCLEVTAATDVQAEARNRLTERFHIPRCYPSTEALLADRSIEAVAICVPADSHIETALLALDAGKHILIEKPLALTLEDCDRLLQRLPGSRSKVTVGFHMRHHRLVRQVRELIQEGLPGVVQSIRSVWNSPVFVEEHLPAWRHQRETGGGVLLEVAVHHFDLWRYLLQTDVAEIFALSRSGRRQDESAVVSGRMTNGMLTSAVFSESSSHQIELELSGSAGRLRAGCLCFDGLEWHPLFSRPGGVRTRLRQLLHTLKELPGGLWNQRRGGDYLGSYREQWRHFCNVIRHDSPIRCTVADGRAALQVALAAVASAEEARPVEVASLSESRELVGK